MLVAWQSSRYGTSTNATARRSPSTTCRSPSSRARSSASWGRTARARPPRSSASRGCARPTVARCASSGSTRERTGRTLRELVGVQLQESALPEKTQGRARHSSSTPPSTATPPTRDDLLAELGLTAQRDTPLQEALRRPEAAAVDRPGTGRQAADRRARRADHRARPAGPPRRVGPRSRPIRDRGVTVLLVTHFMEEAERLCDRIAVIDAGRVVAIDTPAGLVAGVCAETAAAVPPLGSRSTTGCSPTCPRCARSPTTAARSP